MAEESNKPTKRNKPKFLRNDWHKKIKLGRGVKRNQKWRGAKGIHSKVRLNRRGHSSRPRIGWSAAKDTRGKIGSQDVMRVENIQSLASVPKGCAIIIGSIGKKKRQEVITKAKEMKLNILNKYKENQNATR